MRAGAGIWYRARADLRRRLGATLFLVLFVGIAGGTVIAAVAGAARTEEAVPDFVDEFRTDHASVFVRPDLPTGRQNEILPELLALPEWEASGALAFPIVAVTAVGARMEENDGFVGRAVVGGDVGTGLMRPHVVEGERADPDDPTEVTINEALAEHLSAEPGDTFDLRGFAPEQLSDAANGEFPQPSGPHEQITVTGITRVPDDLVFDPQAQDGTLFATNNFDVYLGPAFWAEHGDEIAHFGVGVVGRIDGGPGNVDAIERAVADAFSEDAVVQGGSTATDRVAIVERGVDVAVNAMVAFAVVTGLAAVTLVTQTLVRQITIDATDRFALRALGFERRQILAVDLIRGLVIGVGGAVLAVLCAAVLSPLAPIGTARQAELDPGFSIDARVLATGGLVIVAVVLGAVALASWRAPRWRSERPLPVHRPSRIAPRLGAAGAPVTAVEGTRQALDPGRGQTSVPTGSALFALVLAVAAVTASLVFGASRDQLADDPLLRGWNWDVAVGNFRTKEALADGRRQLEANPDVAEFSGFSSQSISVDDQAVEGFGFSADHGVVGPVVLDGRLPSVLGEVALGRRTMQEVGVSIGDDVELRTGRAAHPVEAEVVGEVLAPAVVVSEMSLGEGAVMTQSGFREVFRDAGEEVLRMSSFLVRFSPGADRATAIERLQEEFPATVLLPTTTSDIEDRRRLGALPYVLAGLVGLIGIGTLVHTLVTAVRNRRRDLAVYATVGFTHRQLMGTIAWEATVFAVVALLIGLPVGTAAGRVVWRGVGDTLGTPLGPATPWLALAAVVLGVLTLANLAALLPGLAAARRSPAASLHAE